MDEFRNESEHKFGDISSEEYRVYEFAGATVRIGALAILLVQASKGE